MLTKLHTALPAYSQWGERRHTCNVDRSCQRIWPLPHMPWGASRQHSRSSLPRLPGYVLAAAVLPKECSSKAPAVRPIGEGSARLHQLRAEVDYLRCLVKTLQSGSTPEQQVTTQNDVLLSARGLYASGRSVFESIWMCLHALCQYVQCLAFCADRGALEGGAGAAVPGTAGVRSMPNHCVITWGMR